MRTNTIALLATLACVASYGLGQCPVERLTQSPSLSPGLGTTAGEIEGDHLLLGDGGAYTACPIPDPFSCLGGAMFAYRWDGNHWVSSQQIVPSGVGLYDGFGLSLDVDGDRMLVVTPRRENNGNRGYFHEYVFNHHTALWVELGRTPGPGTGDSRDGLFPIVFDGSLALVAQGTLIHRYTRDAEGWAFRDSFRSPDGGGGISFGKTIALEGEWAFITASSDATASTPIRHGSVYVYRRHPDDTLEFVQKLLPPGVGDGQTLNFGAYMAFDGQTLAVATTGATLDFRGQGAVHLYHADGDQWTLRHTLTHSDAGRLWYPDGFGRGVSINGDTLVAATNHSSHYQYAYVFRRGGDGAWREVATLEAGEARAPGWSDEQFGLRSDVEGDRVALATLTRTSMPTIEAAAVYSFDLGCEICEADLDADGTLTIFDSLTYANLFQDGDPRADFDGDGELTIFDFLAYQTAFDAGCE
jgi:hypothetical protein